jgi:hypothetical protein
MSHKFDSTQHQNLDLFKEGYVSPLSPEIPSFASRLPQKTVPLRFAPYRLTNSIPLMEESQSLALSPEGVIFESEQTFEYGTILRIHFEIPDYWNKKSRLVTYKHTDAPNFFQALGKVVDILPLSPPPSMSFKLICQIVHIDAVDVQILINET